MNKLLDLVEDRCGEVMRTALANTVYFGGMVLGILAAVGEVFLGIVFVILLFEVFWKALMFLIIDFAAFFLTMFGMFYLVAWRENDD